MMGFPSTNLDAANDAQKVILRNITDLHKKNVAFRVGKAFDDAHVRTNGVKSF
jgi:hypothetical protein